jgi:hypothetical protein
MLRGVRLADPTAAITLSVRKTFEYNDLPVRNKVFAVIRVRKYVIIDVDIFMSFQSGAGKYRARFAIEHITEFEHSPQYILSDRHHHPSIGRSFEFLDHSSTDLIIFPDIGLNIDRTSGGID